MLTKPCKLANLQGGRGGASSVIGRAGLMPGGAAREQLVRERVSERNRLDKRLAPKAAASTRRHIAWLDEEIAELDDEYQALLSNSEVLSQQTALYRSIPGIGPMRTTLVNRQHQVLPDQRWRCNVVGLISRLPRSIPRHSRGCGNPVRRAATSGLLLRHSRESGNPVAFSRLRLSPECRIINQTT